MVLVPGSWSDTQSAAEPLLPPGMAAGLSLWRHVCQRGTRNIKCSGCLHRPASVYLSCRGTTEKNQSRDGKHYIAVCLMWAANNALKHYFNKHIKSYLLFLLVWTNVTKLTKTQTKDIFCKYNFQLIFSLKVNKWNCFLTSQFSFLNYNNPEPGRIQTAHMLLFLNLFKQLMKKTAKKLNMKQSANVCLMTGYINTKWCKALACAKHDLPNVHQAWNNLTEQPSVTEHIWW